MDSVKSVIVSTPSSLISQPTTMKDETPSQECCGQLKKRYLDFNSYSPQSVDNSKPRHGGLPTNKLVDPLLGASRGTKQSQVTVTKPTDNNKITIDKNQLAHLLEMAISHTKAEQKKEEREKREAEMSIKREAKRKKEEEKLRLQSEKIRNQKLQRENFLKFFTKPSSNKATGSNVKRQDGGWIPTFPVQAGMTLAKSPPLLQDKDKFDDVLKIQEDRFVSSYVAECKEKQKTDRKATCSPVNQQSDDDVIIIDEKDDKVKRRETPKYKLLKFHGNYRPAYYGTWQKISKIIQPRNPFKKDESLLDYTVDSDDEWEEEEPGESLSDCHSADEGEDVDDEDDEDGFFVPHGYLSDGEGEPDDNDNAGLPKESKEEKMKMKEKAWEIEFARKCQPLKPVCIGCCWASNGTEANRNVLMQYQAALFTSSPIIIKFDQQEITSNVKTTPKMDKPSSLLAVKSSSPQSTICYKKPVPEEAIPYLIQLLQGSSVGLERTVKNLRVYWGRKVLANKSNGEIQSAHYSESDYEQASGISKRQVEKKIHEIARKVDRIWQVAKSVLEKYSVTSLSKSKPDLHSKVMDVSPRESIISESSPIHRYLLKENLTVNEENKCDIITGKQDDCHSPARKRLKLTETQSSSLAIAQ